MAEPGEVMMPMSKPEALTHIEITVMRQMGENIAAQTRHLELLSGKVDDVRERVIRIEARGYDEQVKGLAKRIDNLEAALNSRVTPLEARGNQVTGVAAFGGWIAQSAPWLLAGIMALMAFLRNKG